MHVAICCITFRRPDGLARLLEGLCALEFNRSAPESICVVIVDNDRTEPMRKLVEQWSGRIARPLIYACEPEQGLANARNRCLDNVPEQTDYIAFIDDDEVPEPQWLDELLAVAQQYEGSIIQGPLIPLPQAGAPDWILDGKFLELGPYTDGMPIHHGYTSNVLIPHDLIRRLNLRFDQRFNLTGGEDEYFFKQATSSGVAICGSERAIVHEWVPASRLTLMYLLRRRFRMGGTLTLIDSIEGQSFWHFKRMIKASGRIALGTVQTATILSRGKVGLATALTNIAWGAGALAGFFGVSYKEYRPKKNEPTSPVV